MLLNHKLKINPANSWLCRKVTGAIAMQIPAFCGVVSSQESDYLPRVSWSGRNGFFQVFLMIDADDKNLSHNAITELSFAMKPSFWQIEQDFCFTVISTKKLTEQIWCLELCEKHDLNNPLVQSYIERVESQTDFVQHTMITCW